MAVLGNVNLTASDGLTAQFQVGDEYNSNGNFYKYFKSAGAIAAYAACSVLGSTGVAAEATTTTIGVIPGAICIPQFAIAAADEYFWAPIGPFRVKDDASTFKVLAANAALNVRLYSTATPGVLDDAVTAGFISGLRLSETVTTQEAADCTAACRLTVVTDNA